MRWGFVIISGLYAVYKYFGITYLLVSIVVCVVLVAIGYSQAVEEEERWNLTFDKINAIISKYFIRLAIVACSIYLTFKNIILTIFSSAVFTFIIFYFVFWHKNNIEEITEFIEDENTN